MTCLIFSVSWDFQERKIQVDDYSQQVDAIYKANISWFSLGGSKVVITGRWLFTGLIVVNKLTCKRLKTCVSYKGINGGAKLSEPYTQHYTKYTVQNIHNFHSAEKLCNRSHTHACTLHFPKSVKVILFCDVEWYTNMKYGVSLTIMQFIP